MPNHRIPDTRRNTTPCDAVTLAFGKKVFGGQR